MRRKTTTKRPDWRILSKYLHKEATDNENSIIEKWADQSGQNQKELDELSQMLEQSDHIFHMEHFRPDKAWNEVQRQCGIGVSPEIPDNPKISQFAVRFYKYAALIIMILTLGSVGYYTILKNNLSDALTENVSSSDLTTREYLLPDSSFVVLNKNSKLKFPKKFENDLRRVQITGEAFFNVKHNPEKPFIIQAENARIRVLGTSFNVSAYPETETVEVIVESGSVQVSCEKPANNNASGKLVLSKGERGSFFKTNNILKKTINRDPNYLSWKTHCLVFSETNLTEVTRQLRKIYNVDIKLNDNELKNLMLTAKFDNKPVDFIINVLQITFDLDVTLKNGQYNLSKQKAVNNSKNIVNN